MSEAPSSRRQTASASFAQNHHCSAQSSSFQFQDPSRTTLIIGDRGKGNSPNSTDGVVPYWSSHLEGAASEKIVPSGHGANENPEGIAEIRRILLEALAH